MLITELTEGLIFQLLKIGTAILSLFISVVMALAYRHREIYPHISILSQFFEFVHASPSFGVHL